MRGAGCKADCRHEVGPLIHDIHPAIGFADGCIVWRVCTRQGILVDSGLEDQRVHGKRRTHRQRIAVKARSEQLGATLPQLDVEVPKVSMHALDRGRPAFRRARYARQGVAQLMAGQAVALKLVLRERRAYGGLEG